MPNENGVYTEEDAAIGHLHSHILSKKLSTILDRTKKIIDFGCGNGDYIQDLSTSGFDVLGIDGLNRNNNPLIQVGDLSTPLDLKIKGQVLSFEVGEHIPKQFESTFIENLVKHSDGLLILSWAVLNQFGIGHINCQNNDYIINQLCSYGFYYDSHATGYLRDGIEEHCSYFKQTLMVFKNDN